MNNKIDLNKGRKNIEKAKNQIKKKHPIVYICLFLIWSYIAFYGGNFLDNSSLVKSTNLFNKLFGQTVVDITEFYNPVVGENNTTIYFEIKNIGDNEIKDLQILYSFCGLNQQKASLEKLKLGVDSSERFSISVPIRLNLSCSVFTDKVEAEVYEDSLRNCFLDIKDKLSNMCQYCKIEFEIYGNNKKINHNPIWYPYLDESINAGKMIRYFLVQYPMRISWKDGNESECKVLYETSKKTGLNKSESIYITTFDTALMCLRGDDIEWCKENYYNKK